MEEIYKYCAACAGGILQVQSVCTFFILVISADCDCFVLAGVTASYFTRFLLLVSGNIVQSDILLCTLFFLVFHGL